VQAAILPNATINLGLMRDIFPFEKNLGEKIFKRNYLNDQCA